MPHYKTVQRQVLLVLSANYKVFKYMLKFGMFNASVDSLFIYYIFNRNRRKCKCTLLRIFFRDRQNSLYNAFKTSCISNILGPIIDIPLLQNVQTDPRSTQLPIHLYLVQRLRMSGDVCLLPMYVFKARTRKTLLFLTEGPIIMYVINECNVKWPNVDQSCQMV